jgi:hypothetical protein
MSADGLALTEEERERLALFNEKADRLLATRLARDGTKLTITWEQDKPLVVELEGLDDEAVDAVVLTARFFIQDQPDRVSFRSLAEIYEKPSIPAELAEHFRKQREKLNGHLDAQSPITFNVPRTRREVFDTFVYGGLSHADAAKRRVFKEWRAHPEGWPLMQSEFSGTLMLLVECVSHVRAVNHALLDTLDA